MSISSEIQKLISNLSDAYAACVSKGATVPQDENFDNLATTISTIPTGGGSSYLTVIPYINDNGTVKQDSDYNLDFGDATTIPNGLFRFQSTNSSATPKPKKVIGNSITSIGEYAFYSFQNASPTGSGAAAAYTTDVEFKGNITTVGTGAFSSAFNSDTALQSVDFRNLARIDGTQSFYNAFKGCTSLTDINFNSLTYVGGSDSTTEMFSGCTSLTSVSFPSLTTINSFYKAFYRCTGLTTVDLSNVTAVGASGLKETFDGCSNLTTVDLSSLTTVGGSGLQNTFRGCSKLTTLDLSSITNCSANYALTGIAENCTSLTTVDLSSITTTGSYQYVFATAFKGCTSLTSVDLSSLTYLHAWSFTNVFQGCTSLRSLSFPSLANVYADTAWGGMLTGCTDVTVHFPAALSSISSWTNVANGFGGTNTTVLFDL